MAEILVKATDNTHSDPNIDRAGCYKKGDVVLAFDDGHVWGAEEGPPKFVIVKVPGLSLATVQAQAVSWMIDHAISVVSHDIPTDSYVLSVTTTEQRSSDDAAGPTVANIQEFLDKWGATVSASDTTSITVDWSITAGAMSPAFLGADITSLGITISETNYDSATGVHTFSVDWTNTTLENPVQAIAQRVTSLGGTILSNDGTTGTFSLPRANVLQAAQNDVAVMANKVYKRRRYSFAPADVDTALAAGGIITLTPAQVASKVIDVTTL